MRHLRKDYFRSCNSVEPGYIEIDDSSSHDSCYTYSSLSQSTIAETSIFNTSHCPTTIPCGVLVNRLEEDTLSTYRFNGPYISAKFFSQREKFRKTLSGCPPNVIANNMQVLDNLMKDRQDMLRRHRRNLQSAKLKFWCGVCLKLANIKCCWSRSYCSEDCQLQEWNAHRPHCTRPTVVSVSSQTD